jgi:hypothetical protein
VIRYAGVLTATGARLRTLSVQAPKGAHIHVACRRGCPHSTLGRMASNVKLNPLLGSYRAGAVMEISVTKPRTIGKFTRITFVRGKAPRRTDLCLWPGAKKPRSCPAKAKVAGA